MNAKNKPVGDFVIHPEEAEIIKLIYYKYVHEGFGLQRLSNFLGEQGIIGRNGKNIPNTSLSRIIKNPMYIGIIHNGEASKKVESLSILDEDTFYRAQEVMTGRIRKHDDIPLNTKGTSLLVGRVFCGHCGNRLTLTTSGRKRTMRDGTLKREVRARYGCHYKVRHPNDCDGQSGYGVTKLDEVVNQVICEQFEKIRKVPLDALLNRQMDHRLNQVKAQHKLLNDQLRAKEQEYEDLRGETIKVIRGTSRLNMDLLNSLVEDAESSISSLKMNIAELDADLSRLESSASSVCQEYANLVSMADIYDQRPIDAKKMVIAQFVKGIYVRRDYEIDIVFNVSFEEFQSLSLEAEKQEAGA